MQTAVESLEAHAVGVDRGREGGIGTSSWAMQFGVICLESWLVVEDLSI